jgi:hypothetical protein
MANTKADPIRQHPQFGRYRKQEQPTPVEAIIQRHYKHGYTTSSALIKDKSWMYS